MYQELVDNYVAMFVEVLTVHSTLDRGDLGRRCVGADEALSSALIRERIDNRGATATLAALIRRALDAA